MGKVVVVGLGPAGPELATTATLAAIAAVPVERRFLRTRRHPSASLAGEAAGAFDDVYEGASSLEEVYATIVDALVAAAVAVDGPVLYAVPGSPLVAERSVELLRADGRVEVEVVPALSFLDLVWSALGVDPLASGVRVVDGHRFAAEAAGERGPLLVAQCDSVRVLSEIKLAFEDEPPPSVVVLQRLGLPDQSVVEVAWSDLDRVVTPDHLTTLWLPKVAAPVAAELARLWDLCRTLRERCPWDREQTHATLTRYALEEAYELVDAVESGDLAHVEEELGDLLYQVYFHAALGAEAGRFNLADVARGIHDKLVHRHPHVFGSVDAPDAATVMANWEQIKAVEKERTSAMDGIPVALPALTLAAKVAKRAAAAGFDWAVDDLDGVDGVYAKVAEELHELRSDGSMDELGDVLFATVNVARHLGHDPETALRLATARFRRRFVAMEALATERSET